MQASHEPAKIRTANLADVPSIAALIGASARALGAGDYSAEQIEAALLGAWGVDTEIIRDGTYFVGERLYARHGYVSDGRRGYALPGGASIDFVPMRRRI